MSRTMAHRRCGGIRFVLLLLLGLLVIGSIAGAGAWVYFNPPYAVTAYLTVEDDSYSPLRPNAPRDYARLQRQTESFVALLKSQRVLEDALMRSEIAQLDVVASKDDPLEWLLDALRIEQVESSYVIEVAIDGWSEEMEEEVRVVDAVIDCFMNSVVFEQRLEARARLDDLNTLVDKLRKEVVDKVAELRRREQEDAASEDKDLEVFRREVANYMDLWKAVHRTMLEQRLVQQLEDQRIGGGRLTGAVRIVQAAFAGEQ